MKTLLALLLTMAAVGAAERKPNISNREDRPRLTQAEHKAEAERYTALAVKYAAKAEGHEKKAAELKSRTGYNAMQHKWPGLANGPQNLVKDKAMQARRMETEARELAAYHAEMAAKPGDTAP